MKRDVLIIVVLLSLALSGIYASAAFTWQINTSLGQGPIYAFRASNADLTVDWGDGNVTNHSGTGTISHDYGVNGMYNVSVNGTATALWFWNYTEGYEDAVIDILTNVSDGISGINSAYMMFRDTENLGLTSLTEPAFFDAVSSNVTDMRYAFQDSNFNQSIGNWDVSQVTNMLRMFSGSKFNQDIGNWNVSSVSNMGYMFAASPFNFDIGAWDVSGVNNMAGMFDDTFGNFNQNISGWNVSSVTTMFSMFRDAFAFDYDLDSWDVSSVQNMKFMFYNSAYNGSIGNWDVSSVTNMNNMFFSSPFNRNISAWDVSGVGDFGGMFYASFFNQDIGNWNVSSASTMGNMFRTTPFDQDISQWDVSGVSSMASMFLGSQLSTTNYDLLLNGWSSISPQLGVNFDAGSSSYCYGDSGRDVLTNTYNWTVTDAGRAPTCNTVVGQTNNTVGVSNFTVTVSSGNVTDYFEENRTIDIRDGNTPLIRLTHDFSQGDFNLSPIIIEKTNNGIAVNMGSALASGKTKTLYLEGTYISVCVKDAPLEDVANITASCTGENETLFTTANCPGTIDGVTCALNSTTWSFSNLSFSGAVGSSPPVPEFHEWALMILLTVALAGVVAMRKRQ